MIVQRSARIGAAGVLLASVCAAHCWAFTSQSTLGAYIFGSGAQDERRAPSPPVARYVSDEGESFVFDRSSPTPLLKFEESSEVIALSPQPVSRGDIIYRDDIGEPVLRVTRLGGLILFAHERPGGAPVALQGLAPVIRLQSMSPQGLGQRLLQASYRASRAARRLIAFDAEEVTPGSEAVFADAAAVAAEAVVHITRRKDAKPMLGRFSRVLFRPGPQGAATVRQGVVSIVINPSQGLAGRPSSARIVEAVSKAK
jgi:hypothetical protein